MIYCCVLCGFGLRFVVVIIVGCLWLIVNCGWIGCLVAYEGTGSDY